MLPSSDDSKIKCASLNLSHKFIQKTSTRLSYITNRTKFYLRGRLPSTSYSSSHTENNIFKIYFLSHRDQLSRLNSNTASIVNTIQKNTSILVRKIFVNRFPCSLPMTVVINNQNTILLQKRK